MGLILRLAEVWGVKYRVELEQKLEKKVGFWVLRSSRGPCVREGLGRPLFLRRATA